MVYLSPNGQKITIGDRIVVHSYPVIVRDTNGRSTVRGFPAIEVTDEVSRNFVFLKFAIAAIDKLLPAAEAGDFWLPNHDQMHPIYYNGIYFIMRHGSSLTKEEFFAKYPYAKRVMQKKDWEPKIYE